MANLNFKALQRSMNIKTTTNTERINYRACGKQLKPDHYHRLLKQSQVYYHPTLPLIVVKTDKNKKIKIIDSIRIVELFIEYGDKYPSIVFDGKIYKVHTIIAESYAGRTLRESENIHHINHNRYDYDFDNLIILNKKLHEEIHKLEYKA